MCVYKLIHSYPFAAALASKTILLIYINSIKPQAYQLDVCINIFKRARGWCAFAILIESLFIYIANNIIICIKYI